MGLIDDWRLRNIFGRPQPTIGDLPITGQGVFQPRNISTPPIISAPPSNPPDTTTSRIPTPALDEFKAYLETQPSRKEHQLSKVGKALALASGAIHGGLRKDVAGGIGVGQGLMEQPYERAIEDWKSRGGLLEKKAGIETAERALEREVAKEEREANLASQKNIRENILAQSRLFLDEANVNRINHEIDTGKYDYFQGQDGFYYKTDKKTGSTEKVIQTGLTPEQKAQLDYTWWKKKEIVEQGNRIQLAGINHANDLIRMDRKHLFDAELIKYRQDLENSGVSVLNQNRAFEGAISEIKQTMPDLYAEVFDPVTGSMKEDAKPEAMQRYANTLKNITNRKLGEEVPSIGLPSRTGPAGRAIQDVTGTEAPASTETSETTDPIRQQAIKFLQENKAPDGSELEVDEDNINAVMEQIRNAAPASNVPPVTIPPPVAAPPVNLPTMPNFGPVNPATGLANPTLNLGPNFGSVNPQLYSEAGRVYKPPMQAWEDFLKWRNARIARTQIPRGSPDRRP